ncbi:MAG: hypothetical protein HFF02_02985 [Erysipelotrichaceae bacterium]|nr:hypothetical protein [Erysipelotrichaceae bacterium]
MFQEFKWIYLMLGINLFLQIMLMIQMIAFKKQNANRITSPQNSSAGSLAFCKQCGTQFDASQAFCPKCGSPR